ncbi:CHASE2 domain-containing protein [Candidatus Desantisbacteria bacterium]|nr:CHASE2 domain-containing protein [Candidatus Desantisbacteria bacterium]
MEKVRKQRKIRLLVGLVVGIFVSILYVSGVLEGMEWLWYDMKFRLRGEQSPDKRIIIVAIDEQSLKKIGRWPWNRKYHAELIDRLHQAGVKTIGMDILFAEPDRQYPLGDRRLIEATTAARCVSYLLTCGDIEGDLKWIQPFPELAKAAAGLGYGNIEVSSDGIVRQVSLVQEIRDNRFFAFGLEIVRNYLKVDKIHELEDTFAVGDLRVPKRIMYINFGGTRFEQISYYKVLKEKFPVNYFKDRIVLVGSVAKGLTDEKSTPFSKDLNIISGVEVQANIIKNILNQSYIVPLSRIAIILLIFILGLITALLIKGAKIEHDVIITLSILAGIILISFLSFSYLYLQLPVVPLLLTVALVATGVMLAKVLIVEHKLHEKILEFFKGSRNEEDMGEQVEAIAMLTRELKELDELKSDLMSMVAHEFRTPLTSVKGYTSMLLDGDAGTINEKQRKFLDMVNENTDRLINLIENFLDVAKIESGKIGMKMEEFNLNEILIAVSQTFIPIAKKKDIHLHINIPEESLLLKGDKTRLRQVLDNLVNNAVKYTPEQGEVILDAEIEAGNIRVSVKDTGMGISKEDQKKVFDKFFRTKTARRTEISGTGLGLSIVKSIVEKHGGSIRLESEVGNGSVFTVILPQSFRPI